jgi:hypothetical protein
VPATPISVCSFGVRVQVLVGEPRLVAGVRRLLPPGASALDWDDAYPPFRLAAASSDAVALGDLDARIRAHVAANAPDHVFVHAGVVLWRDRAIVMPGRSRAGKSTLVAAFLRAGAEYASDEFAVLDAEGLVWPYPRRLSIRDGSGVTEVEAAALGARCAAGPAPIGLVLITRFVAGAAWTPRSMGAAGGVSTLMANTPVARAAPDRVLRVLGRAAAAAPVLEGPRGEAVPTADAILRSIPATW